MRNPTKQSLREHDGAVLAQELLRAAIRDDGQEHKLGEMDTQGDWDGRRASFQERDDLDVFVLGATPTLTPSTTSGSAAAASVPRVKAITRKQR